MARAALSLPATSSWSRTQPARGTCPTTSKARSAIRSSSRSSSQLLPLPLKVLKGGEGPEEADMQILQDRLAIHDLLVRYTTALDAGDVATVVDCFTADAVLESP